MRRLDFICKNNHIQLDVMLGEEGNPSCPTCGEPTDTFWSGSFMVNGDDIPGGMEIKHGICWPDGTPRKFYSKSEIRKAASDAGWTIDGETPKLPSHVEDRKWREAEKRKRNFI